MKTRIALFLLVFCIGIAQARTEDIFDNEFAKALWLMPSIRACVQTAYYAGFNAGTTATICFGAQPDQEACTQLCHVLKPEYFEVFPQCKCQGGIR